MSTDDIGELVDHILASEKARVEKVRTVLFDRDTCTVCGAIVGDQAQHQGWHEAESWWKRSAADTFDILGAPMSYRRRS